MPQHPKISVRLPPELHALLLARVGHSGRVSDVIREALETYLGHARPTNRPTASVLSHSVRHHVRHASNSQGPLWRRISSVLRQWPLSTTSSPSPSSLTCSMSEASTGRGISRPGKRSPSIVGH